MWEAVAAKRFAIVEADVRLHLILPRNERLRRNATEQSSAED